MRRIRSICPTHDDEGHLPATRVKAATQTPGQAIAQAGRADNLGAEAVNRPTNSTAKSPAIDNT